MKKIYGLFCGLLLLNACASDKEKMDTMSAEELYNMAYENLGATKYAKAAEIFEKVETDHPYSQWAVKSKLMGAFAYYKDEKYDDAVMAIDRYIKYHPGNKDVPYALYLKGMCYYDQISSADKDQGDTAKAADAFGRLIALFPDSKYAEDARGKMNLTEDYKAGQEMIIGRYYLNDGNYLSALNRFNVVLEEYQTTIQIEEALYRQVEIYAILGLNKYADGYYKILRDNYPEGKWTAKAAKVMKKIGEEDKEPVVSKVEKKVEKQAEDVKGEVKEQKGWFSRTFGGWFSSDDAQEKNEAKAEEVKAQAEEVKAKAEEKTEEVKADTEEQKGWFSRTFGGWFSSDEAQEKTEEKAEEVKAQAEEVKAKAEDKTEEAKADAEEQRGWFSRTFGGWFSSDDAQEKTEAKAEEVKAQAEEVKAKAEDKTEEAKADAEEQRGWFSRTWHSWFGKDEPSE